MFEKLKALFAQKKPASQPDPVEFRLWEARRVARRQEIEHIDRLERAVRQMGEGIARLEVRLERLEMSPEQRAAEDRAKWVRELADVGLRPEDFAAEEQPKFGDGPSTVANNFHLVREIDRRSAAQIAEAALRGVQRAAR